MRAAAGVLALLALLAGASVDACTKCNDRGPCAGEHRPRISATIEDEEAVRQGMRSGKILDLTYAADITMFCSASGAASIIKKKNGQALPAARLNSSTVMHRIEKPDTGEHPYACVDISTGCEDCLTFEVYPAISVISPELRYKLIDGEQKYFVPLNEEFEIICGGNDCESMSIQYDYFDGMFFNVIDKVCVNDTAAAAKNKSRADIAETRRYSCSGKLTSYATVVANYLPEAQNIQCISHQRRTLACSWSTLNKNNAFELYLLYKNNTILICSLSSGATSRICTWDYNIKTRREAHLYVINYIDLLLQTCNEVFCQNQTLTLHHDSILKLEAPINLRVINVSSRGASVAWSLGVNTWWLNPDHELRLDYRLLGALWRQANLSSVQCDWGDCKFNLTLECPNAHYEVRVYVRSKTATEDKFWSDPASVIFFTNRQNIGPVPHAECYPEIKQRKPLPSVEQMLFKVEQLMIIYRRINDLTLQTQVDTLMDKRDEIKLLTELLNGNM